MLPSTRAVRLQCTLPDRLHDVEVSIFLGANTGRLVCYTVDTSLSEFVDEHRGRYRMLLARPGQRREDGVEVGCDEDLLQAIGAQELPWNLFVDPVHPRVLSRPHNLALPTRLAFR